MLFLGYDRMIEFCGEDMAILVRSASLTKYSEIACAAGIDPVRALREVGLDPSCLHSPDLRIPELSLARVFEASAKPSACPSLGVRIGEAWRLSDFGAVSLFLQHQPTLRQVLAQIERYRHLLSDSVAIRVDESQDVVVLHVVLVTGRPHPGREIVELTVGVLFSLVRAMLGPQYEPRGVHFAHAAPDSLRVYRRFFGPKVDFDSGFDGIVITRRELDRPNPLADSRLAYYAQELLALQPRPGHDSIADDVRRALHILVPNGQGAIEPVSRRLGVAPRTLQRQLEQTGNSFSSLVNEVRASLALRYLSHRHFSVSDVADLVGFSEISAFSRWFSAEFGKPPSRWRSDCLDTADRSRSCKGH
ncbi:AraC family transcriptional regulator [Caballeronia choica]|uniref:AraC family transcriptional regulator n=2 Tax=Caballeronia choica TaxID=326476 RepID=A0A158IY86_9BURK|nr:AraC family transcriptional regulator [Caballeronia choica]